MCALNFCAVEFVGSLLLCKDVFFMFHCFSQTAIDSHGTLHLVLGVVRMHSAAASILAVTKFS